jgi:hypothetical protein
LRIPLEQPHPSRASKFDPNLYNFTFQVAKRDVTVPAPFSFLLREEEKARLKREKLAKEAKEKEAEKKHRLFK